MKRYYIEIDDDGNETKRKQTVHETIEMKELNLEEQLDVFYEATAEMLSKVRKVNMMFDEIVQVPVNDLMNNQTFKDALDNINASKEFLK